MLLAVVDANVFLSGLLHGRGTSPVLAALHARKFQLVTSETLVGELTRVMSQPEFLALLDPVECHDVLTIIREAATFVSPTQHLTICRDPQDNAVLEVALAMDVDCLVTGDRDLLTLHPFRSIRILRPAEFLRWLR